MIIVIPMITTNLPDTFTGPRQQTTNKPSPIIICDFTRSDEQYSLATMKQYAQYFASDLITNGVIAGLSGPIIYSLDYTMTYSHDGISYGNSLKTRFNATISNPPMDLVTLLRIQQYTSQQNLNLLETAISSIVDSQVAFPTGGFVIKDLKGNLISRNFTLYSTPYNPDSRRVNSSIGLIGADYDDIVMRLNFSVNLNTTETLKAQMDRTLTGYNVAFDFASAELKPVVAKYYSPAPINSILAEICLDNNLMFDAKGINIDFFKPDPKSPPPPQITQYFSFDNSVPNTKLIGNFNLTNYATAEFESELFSPTLFTSISIYDDSDSIGLFANLSRIQNSTYNGIIPYRFYLLSYVITDSREKTSVMITATNNWIISISKLDTIFESKVYQNALNG
jgi:hypothetical protein